MASSGNTSELVLLGLHAAVETPALGRSAGGGRRRSAPSPWGCCQYGDGARLSKPFRKLVLLASATFHRTSLAMRSPQHCPGRLPPARRRVRSRDEIIGLDGGLARYDVGDLVELDKVPLDKMPWAALQLYLAKSSWSSRRKMPPSSASMRPSSTSEMRSRDELVGQCSGRPGATGLSEFSMRFQSTRSPGGKNHDLGEVGPQQGRRAPRAPRRSSRPSSTRWIRTAAHRWTRQGRPATKVDELVGLDQVPLDNVKIPLGQDPPDKHIGGLERVALRQGRRSCWTRPNCARRHEGTTRPRSAQTRFRSVR